jgi:hypothetical protein
MEEKIKSYTGPSPTIISHSSFFFFETRSQYFAEASFELMILLPQSPICWITGMNHCAWLIPLH